MIIPLVAHVRRCVRSLGGLLRVGGESDLNAKCARNSSPDALTHRKEYGI